MEFDLQLFKAIGRGRGYSKSGPAPVKVNPPPKIGDKVYYPDAKTDCVGEITLITPQTVIINWPTITSNGFLQRVEKDTFDYIIEHNTWAVGDPPHRDPWWKLEDWYVKNTKTTIHINEWIDLFSHEK